MTQLRYALAAALVAATFALSSGCVPSIGDPCRQNADCPTGATCDSTAPDGYCTISECDPGSCPAGSVCVEFDGDTSFCMRHCKEESECRDAYVCRDDPGRPRFCYISR